MKPRQRFHTNRHRCARLVLWAQTMLAWLAAALFSETQRANRRRIRQRYRFAALDWAAHLVRALAIARALDITGVVGRAPRARSAPPPGFRRRAARTPRLRACAGSRFRKALKHRDPRRRLQLLLAALGGIDALARRYIVARALNGLTRIAPIVLIAPPAHARPAQTAPAVAAADSS